MRDCSVYRRSGSQGKGWRNPIDGARPAGAGRRLPVAGVEMYYYDKLGCHNSDQPDDASLGNRS